MEQVTHRVHEDLPWLFPQTRQINQVFLQGDPETIPIPTLPHRLQPLGHPLGVAVLTAGTYLGAAGDGVPGGLGPFNTCDLCHLYSI